MSKKNKNRLKPPRRRPLASSQAPDAERFRRRCRMARPRAVSEEKTEDVAVFDDDILARLDASLAAQVVAVRESLALVSQSRDEDAKQRLSTISRSSPMSEWRLFIRGLIEWYAENTGAATDTWKRLDPARRPARIAITLQASTQQESSTWNLNSPAKMVRMFRVDRPAIREAAIETAKVEKKVFSNQPDILIGAEKIRWLKIFSSDYRSIESQLVEAIQHEALRRAFMQPYADLFQQVVENVPGPRHDPKNTLLQSLYHSNFEGGEALTEQLMNRYLTKELPGNDELSKSLRGAIQSQAYLTAARTELAPPSFPSFGFWSEPEDDVSIDTMFKRAIKAYPSNRAAHTEYIEWIKERLENDRTDKTPRLRFQKRLPLAMTGWCKSIPDDVEPRLWLAEYYLEDEQPEEAKPHIQWLTLSRHADPRVRAMPWKCQLLEAMRLCRRKAWLPQVSDRLNESRLLWPSWLCQDWYPYLHAALALRCGQTDEFRKQRTAIDQTHTSSAGQLTSDLMMLAAAQRMRLPSAELKPLREPVDAAVKAINKIPDSQLLAAGSFFWDLHRTLMLYPAYRMHGGKFAKELVSRLTKTHSVALEIQSDPNFWGALLWLSERRFCNDGYESRLPGCLLTLSGQPKVAAAIVSTVTSAKYTRPLQNHSAEIDLLRDAALHEQDPFYRYWFGQLVQRAEEALEELSRPSMFGGFENMFKRFGLDPFGYDDDSEDDEEGDDEEDEFGDLSFDPECMCPECVANRKAAGHPEPDPASTPSDNDLFWRIDAPSKTSYDPPELNPKLNLDPRIELPAVPSPKMDIPRDPELRRTRTKNPMANKRKNNR